jgi:hypothetical protein
MTKKRNSIGATSWYHRVADDSRFRKKKAIILLKTTVHPRTQIGKKNPAWNDNSHLFRMPFFRRCNRKEGIVGLNLLSNGWVSRLLIYELKQTLAILDFVIPKIRFCCCISQFWEVGVGTLQSWADNWKQPWLHLWVYDMNDRLYMWVTISNDR